MAKKASSSGKEADDKAPRNQNVNKILVENFVSLQKVLTNLSVNFENLSVQISKLLELFELSAKTLAEKDFRMEKDNKDTNEIKNKIDNLMEQNKTIAKGLLMLHEKEPGISQNQIPFPQQFQQRKPAMNEKNIGVDRYQKSITSGREDAPKEL
jgi:hypothetical protein